MSDDYQSSDPLSPGSLPPGRRRGGFFGTTDGKTRWQRRQERIRNEIARNRSGEFKIPTWVLTAILVVLVVGFGLFIAFA
jgi:hypothetical protein